MTAPLQQLSISLTFDAALEQVRRKNGLQQDKIKLMRAAFQEVSNAA